MSRHTSARWLMPRSSNSVFPRVAPTATTPCRHGTGPLRGRVGRGAALLAAVVTLLAGCSGGSGGQSGSASAACSDGLHATVVPLPSGVAVPDNHVNVLLPRGYCAHPHQAYPVLYLLHG